MHPMFSFLLLTLLRIQISISLESIITQREGNCVVWVAKSVTDMYVLSCDGYLAPAMSSFRCLPLFTEQRFKHFFTK